jgi:hypothetical protein
MGDEVYLEIAEEGADDARLEELALMLRQELLALDVRSVEPYAAGEAPEGSRAGFVAIAGLLAVYLQPGLQAVGAIVAVVSDWLHRSGSGRTVKIAIDGDSIEMTGATDKVQQQQLVDAWLKRHAGTGA